MPLLALAAVIAGCGGNSPGDARDRRDGRPSAGPSDTNVRPVSSSRTIRGCRATLPNSTPPFPGEDFNYGNRHLGVALWERGKLVAGRLPDGSAWGVVNPDGSIYAKLGWWRATPGRLTIQGERLDAPAPPLSASVPAGYGSAGFQATGLTFPARGCWRVVGSVAGHQLEFVVLVTIRAKA